MTHVHLVAEGQLTPNEALICRRAVEVLHRYYPGHPWGVEINGAMLTIRNRRLVGQWGYRINLLQHPGATLEHELMQAGGEYLERYGLRRGAKDEDAVRELPRDFKGDMVPEL